MDSVNFITVNSLNWPQRDMFGWEKRTIKPNNAGNNG
jgi:hypothetical protein